MFVLLIAAVATAAALPFVFVILRKGDLLDVPNGRSLHTIRVYRGGGLACIFGVACGLGTAQLRGETVLWTAVSMALAIGLVGLVDDVSSLGAGPRLTAQAAIGGVAGAFIGHSLPATAAAAFVFVATVNVVNFMDGVNGISGLTVGLWGVTALVAGTTDHSPALVPVGAVTAGAALAFLPANLPTARLFLGDVGSYFFGGLIAVGILIGFRDGVSPAVLVAPLSVYLADAGYTLIRRTINRAPLLSAHREHVYQRLVSVRGLSHSEAALMASGTAGAVTLCWIPGFSLVAVLGTAVLIGGYLSSPRLLPRRRPAMSGARS